MQPCPWSVPIRLPATKLFGTCIIEQTPAKIFTKIRFPAPVPGVEVRPPMVLPGRVIDRITPPAGFVAAGILAQRDSPGHVGADEVAFDEVVIRPVDLDPETDLPEMMLRAAAVMPPIVLPEPVSMSTPSAFGTAAVPLKSVPIKSPATTLPVAPVPVISTPSPVLPEMTLLEPSAMPPIVLLDESLISTPSPSLAMATAPLSGRCR